MTILLKNPKYATTSFSVPIDDEREEALARKIEKRLLKQNIIVQVEVIKNGRLYQ